MASHFRLRLRNLFAATFWVAVGGFAWSVRDSNDLQSLTGKVGEDVINCAVIFFMFGAPIIAVGALFGRTKIGIWIATAIFLAFLLLAPRIQ